MVLAVQETRLTQAGQAPGAAGGVGRAVGATVDSGASAVDVEAVRQQLQQTVKQLVGADASARPHQRCSARRTPEGSS